MRQLLGGAATTGRGGNERGPVADRGRAGSLLELCGLALVLVLAYALRLYRLEDANIWWDEGLAVWAARQSPGAIAAWTAADVHPPLYFWLVHGWRLLAGDGEFAVRWLSVAFGTLSVAVLWRLGRSLAGPRVALLAALFLALSRFAVWWSQEARMYMLGGLLATLSLVLTVRLRRRPSWDLALAYVVVTAAALWTLYLLAFILVIESLYWLGDWRVEIGDWRRRGAMLIRAGARPAAGPRLWGALGLWVGLQAVVLLSFLPWLDYALPRLPSWSVQVPFDPKLYGQLYATLLAVGASVDIDRYRPVTLAVLGILIFGLLLLIAEQRFLPTRAHNRATPLRTTLPVPNLESNPSSEARERISNLQSPISSSLLLLSLTLLLPPLVVWLVTTIPREIGYAPKPEARYLLPYAPAFSLLLAWAVAGIEGGRGWALQRPWARTVMAGLAAAGLVGVEAASLRDYFAGRVREDDYISLAATMRAYWREGDTVLLHTDQPWPVFAYHWGGPFEGITYTQPVAEAGAVARLDSISNRHSGVWLVLNEDAQRVDPNRVVERLLAGRAAAQREWRFGSKRLVLFTLAAGRAATIMELSPTWAPSAPPTRLVSSEVELVGWEQALRRYRPGDVAHLFATVDLTPGCVSASGCSPVLTLILGNPEAPVASATTVAELSGAGQRQRLQFDVLIPPDAAAGRSSWILTQGQQHVTTGAAAVLARRPSAATTAPEIAVPLETTFGEPPLLKLLGYDLRSHVAPGESAHLTLYWQGLRTIPLPFKVFTHLIDADERMWGQKDDVPVAGTRPTTGWMPGEIIVDGYEIAVSPDTPPGRYMVEIGLYDAGTGTRLGPVRDADGRQLNGERVLLGEIEVRAAD